MNQIDIPNINEYGPLSALIGTWEGDKGQDTAPSDDRGTEQNLFRERIVFEPMNPVQNHEQTLYVLRYQTKAWRLVNGSPEKDPFHEELGYWSYEPKTKLVMRNFLVPRGVALIAGGQCEPNAKEFSLKAEAGSPTFGICVNPFLDQHFKITEYLLSVAILDHNYFKYEEDTVIQMPGKPVFHHKDRNTLQRIGYW